MHTRTAISVADEQVAHSGPLMPVRVTVGMRLEKQKQNLFYY